MAAHLQLLDKAKQGGIDVYFVGDSIVRRGGATDYPEYLANWRRNFFGWNAADFGWGADRTENILWRLVADGQRVRYLNINDRLADAHGMLRDGMVNADGLHPALPGYQVWADALKPILTEMLGPPSATDHAPPPTGDPSAAR